MGSLWLQRLTVRIENLADKSDFTNFFIVCPENPFGQLLSKITIKLCKEFLVLRNLAKREMSCSGTTGATKICQEITQSSLTLS